MDSLFPIRVWALTAVFASFFIVIGITIFVDDSGMPNSFIPRVLNIAFIGLSFSLPAFMFHYFSLRFFSTRIISIQTLKIVSAAIGITALILLSIFFELLSLPLDSYALIPLAYILGLIISTYLISYKKTNNNENVKEVEN